METKKEIAIETEEKFDMDNRESSEEEKPLSLKRYDITVYPADYTLSVLVDKIKKGDIVIPEFQRGYVWDIKKASRLIESFLLGLPVPPIYLYMTKEGKLLIIDGQQRTKTIQYFFEGKFPTGSRNKEFKLKFMDNSPSNNKWEGKSFESLEEEDRLFLENAVMRAFIIRQINPDDETSMFYIFERLNTGGMPLYPMEIRKAIYYGNFFKLMETLNQEGVWRELIGSDKLDSRLRDIEYILRFFALYEEWKEYESPMKDFLTNYMSKNKEVSQEKLKKFEDVFKRTVLLINKALGEKPFHTYKGRFNITKEEARFKRLNLAVLDSFMVNTALLINKLNEQIVKDVYEELKVNENFYKNITERDTTRTKILKERFNIVYSLIVRKISQSGSLVK